MANKPIVTATIKNEKDAAPKEPAYISKEFSLVSRAREEFNKSLPKGQQESKTMQTRKGANPTKQRSALGRGLSALMSSTVPTTEVSLSSNTGNSKAENQSPSQQEERQSDQTIPQKESNDLKKLAIDQLEPNPNQPRVDFPAKELRDLATSIRKSGLLQPILVRKSPTSKSSFSRYQIIAGERRWRAAKEAGLIKVPVLIRDFTDREALENGIIENVQRQDLNPIEEAQGYQRLHIEFSLSQDEIAKAVGKDRSSISNCMRLLKLSPEVQKLLLERKLSSGHARVLISIEDESEQLRLANKFIEENYTVRDAEGRVSQKKAGKTKKASQNSPRSESSPHAQAIEDRLRRSLGTKVKVDITASGKGEVRISFFSNTELESFLEKLGA